MRFRSFLILAILCLGLLSRTGFARAQSDATPTPGLENPPNPAELIAAINDLRMSHGLPALTAHPALMQVAQMEASGIANGMDGHWRPQGMTLGQWLMSVGYPLSGDLTQDGYRSENWVAASTSAEAIQFWLGDDEHSNTMLSPDRSDIGAGVAVSDQIYVVVETALRTASGQMQSEGSIILTGIPQTQVAYSALATEAAKNGTSPQFSMPVGINTPMPGGDVYHKVQYGQSLWSIAIAYKTTIKSIQQLNNLGSQTIYTGQKLLVMKNATSPAPLAAPSSTPAGATQNPTATLPAQQIKIPIAVPSATAPAAPDPFARAQNGSQTLMVTIVLGFAGMFLLGVFVAAARQKKE